MSEATYVSPAERRKRKEPCPVCGEPRAHSSMSAHIRRMHPEAVARFVRKPGRPQGSGGSPQPRQFDPEGRERCPECGLWYRFLYQHRRERHGWSARRDHLELCPGCLEHPRPPRPDGSLRGWCEWCEARQKHDLREQSPRETVRYTLPCKVCGEVMPANKHAPHVRAEHPEAVDVIKRWTRRAPYPARVSGGAA